MAGGPQVRLTPTNIVFFSFARTAAAQNEYIARATFFLAAPHLSRGGSGG